MAAAHRQPISWNTRRAADQMHVELLVMVYLGFAGGAVGCGTRPNPSMCACHTGISVFPHVGGYGDPPQCPAPPADSTCVSLGITR